ncbi:hypothetical protein BZA77DRAFT_343432 [Pyronema omphalodes]|nr:hypothetical protein BZA77DRAFT_343432 [Pyronema omphalodes]
MKPTIHLINSRNYLTVAGSCWITGFVFLILRLYQKLRVQRLRFSLSDGLICVAVILELINRGAVGLVVTSLTRTLENDTPEYIVLARRFLMTITAVIVIYLIKASFLLTYWNLHRRTPGNTPQRFFLIISACIALVGVLPNVLFLLLHCRPLKENWNYYGQCRSMYSKPASGVFNSINIISDLLVIAYGIGLVKQLHSRRKAYAAAIVTGLGALSTAACAVRWIKTWKDGYQEQWLWFSVEICAGIVAACLPTLHAWLRLQLMALDRVSAHLEYLDDNSDAYDLSSFHQPKWMASVKPKEPVQCTMNPNVAQDENVEKLAGFKPSPHNHEWWKIEKRERENNLALKIHQLEIADNFWFA